MVDRSVVGVGDILCGDEFVVRPVVHDEGTPVVFILAEDFGDDASVGSVGAVEDRNEGIRMMIDFCWDFDIGEVEDGGEEIGDMDEFVASSGLQNVGPDGEEGNVDSSFIEGALGSGDATGGSLIDLTGGAVVADDNDVGFVQVDRSQETGDFVIECFEAANVEVLIAISGGRVATGGSEVGGWIMEGSVRGIEAHPDDPGIGALAGDEGNGLIDLYAGSVGR